ncbi:hypothetical protein [Engelhardtia mirabilis]|uniref:Uncharacterized protein n=1 Tax=Engelhardtia mirabilis TaxID=2528011 RepID=A0A518BDZ7_9BACT|nr:hypothetical protein Pla133_02500 [Planctomycetes bacterium Pla133]QDU99512.1 hypothetical protein Pla86_02500 [Planctomycetes bacterium Pla86]
MKGTLLTLALVALGALLYSVARSGRGADDRRAATGASPAVEASAEAQGPRSLATEVVRERAGGDVSTLDLPPAAQAASPSSVVVIRVVGPDGSPSVAEVGVVGLSATGFMTEVELGRTDADGIALTTREALTGGVEVFAGTDSLVGWTRILAGEEIADETLVQLRAASELSGRVVDLRGSPVGGAEVVGYQSNAPAPTTAAILAQEADGWGNPRRTTTDPDGRFRFGAVDGHSRWWVHGVIRGSLSGPLAEPARPGVPVELVLRPLAAAMVSATTDEGAALALRGGLQVKGGCQVAIRRGARGMVASNHPLLPLAGIDPLEVDPTGTGGWPIVLEFEELRADFAAEVALELELPGTERVESSLRLAPFAQVGWELLDVVLPTKGATQEQGSVRVQLAGARSIVAGRAACSDDWAFTLEGLGGASDLLYELTALDDDQLVQRVPAGRYRAALLSARGIEIPPTGPREIRVRPGPAALVRFDPGVLGTLEIELGPDFVLAGTPVLELETAQGLTHCSWSGASTCVDGLPLGPCTVRWFGSPPDARLLVLDGELPIAEGTGSVSFDISADRPVTSVRLTGPAK